MYPSCPPKPHRHRLKKEEELEEEEEEEEEQEQERTRKKDAKSLFFTSRGEYVNLRYNYSDVIHLFDWKSAVEHDGGV